jgi:plasmid maintenance system antidote protein VapI
MSSLSQKIVVDTISSTEIQVVVITSGDVLIQFNFAALKLSPKQLWTDLMVSINDKEPLHYSLNVLISKERSDLALDLKKYLPNIDLNWSAVINQTIHHMRMALKRVSSALVTELAGNDNEVSLPFILEPYIIEQGGTFLFGDPGSGKSYIALLMAVSINYNVSTFFKVRKQTKVLYINLERSEQSMVRRLGRVNKVLGLHPHSALHFINGRSKTLEDMTETLKLAVSEQEFGLVILDSMSKAGSGDLSDPSYANSIIAILNGLNCAWVSIAHAPRASNNHAFGSVMQDAAADVMVTVKGENPDAQTLLVNLYISKANDIPMSPFATRWRLNMNQNGLVSVESGGEAKFNIKEPNVTNQDRIREFLEENSEASTQQIASALDIARESVSKILNTAGFKVKRQDGRVKFYCNEDTPDV